MYYDILYEEIFKPYKTKSCKKNSRTSVNPINLLTFFFVSTLNEKTHFSAIEFKAAYHIRQSVKKTFQRSSIREKTFLKHVKIT